MSKRLLAYFLAIVLLMACGSQPQQPTVQVTSTSTLTPSPIPSPTNTPTPTITFTPTVTPTPTPLPMAGPVTENFMTRLGKGWINNLTFSPNGWILAIATSIGVYLYQVNPTIELISFLPSDAFVTATIFIDDKTLVIGEGDDSTTVWDIEGTPKVLETLQRTNPVIALSVTENQTILILENERITLNANVVQWDRELIQKMLT